MGRSLNLLPASAIVRLPTALVLLFLLFGGIFLINKADAQARDTIRKHHLEDIEQSLYVARIQHGTYPPYDEFSWCGRLNDPANADLRSAVETALRAQHEKYANQEKPFPTDPLANSDYDYFYWKRSPAIFELYAQLEADRTSERNTRQCAGAVPEDYDYGITSVLRQG